MLQRRHRISSNTLIYDRPFCLRCQQCNRRDSFDIGIIDMRHRGYNRQPRVDRSIVSREH